MATTQNQQATEIPSSLIDRRQAAALLNIGLRTLDELIAGGDLPVIRIRTSVRFRRSALDAFIEASETRVNPKRRATRRGLHQG